MNEENLVSLVMYVAEYFGKKIDREEARSILNGFM